MPLDGTTNDVETDFEILEAIGRHHDALAHGRIQTGAPLKTLRRWLLGHREPPEDGEAMTGLAAMAVDLDLFTPSMSGKTLVDRYLSARRPDTARERQALDALAAAQFRLVRIVGRDGPERVRLKDLGAREDLVLLNTRISSMAAGSATAMRLCPLPSGRHVLISPLFAIDEDVLAAAMAFVRPGRPLGHRCAASLYRDVARRGFMPLETYFTAAEIDHVQYALEVAARLSEVEHLALRWLAAGGPQPDKPLMDDIRRAASTDSVVDACGCFGKIGADAPAGLGAVFERIAEIQMATIAQRAQTGPGGGADGLDGAADAIDRFIAQGAMLSKARTLFDRLRAPFRARARRGGSGAPGAAELDRVMGRIRALRAKTVDRGCTEDEAMAAAAKVAELLDRHDLTLDEVSVRESPCEGLGVDTGRRRRAPVDSCNQPLADFCDCRLWAEQTDSGVLRYVFFGLKADVEAARFLHALIEAAFETETAAFRKTAIHLTLRGGGRRAAVNSFQIGMASGVSGKLARLKSARQAARPRTSGFDLVAVKHSVVDDEVDKLGLKFTTKTTGSRRRVHGDAYEAGKAAGALFEPEASLGR